MDTTLDYRLKCLKSKEIQEEWYPQMGDYMVALASYCDCEEKEPCSKCLEMSNVFVISSQFDFNESVGGTHWFFGAGTCIRGEGIKCNSTYSHVMTESGDSEVENEFYICSKNKMLWLPRQDQIQSMMLNNYNKTDVGILYSFTDWIENNIKINELYPSSSYSLEELWLMYYMYTNYNKIWNNKDWVEES